MTTSTITATIQSSQRSARIRTQNNNVSVQNKNFWPKLPNRSQIASGAAVIGVSLAIGKIIEFIAQKLNLEDKTHKFSFKETMVHFTQSFLAILGAMYASRVIANGPFKLSSYKSALQAFNQKLFLLSSAASAFNVSMDWLSELAKHAQPQAEKLIGILSLIAKISGSIGLVKWLGAGSSEAGLGSIATEVCGCGCTLPRFACPQILQTLAPLAQNAYNNIVSFTRVKGKNKVNN